MSPSPCGVVTGALGRALETSHGNRQTPGEGGGLPEPWAAALPFRGGFQGLPVPVTRTGPGTERCQVNGRDRVCSRPSVRRKQKRSGRSPRWVAPLPRCGLLPGVCRLPPRPADGPGARSAQHSLAPRPGRPRLGARPRAHPRPALCAAACHRRSPASHHKAPRLFGARRGAAPRWSLLGSCPGTERVAGSSGAASGRRGGARPPDPRQGRATQKGICWRPGGPPQALARGAAGVLCSGGDGLPTCRQAAVRGGVRTCGAGRRGRATARGAPPPGRPTPALPRSPVQVVGHGHGHQGRADAREQAGGVAGQHPRRLSCCSESRREQGWRRARCHLRPQDKEEGLCPPQTACVRRALGAERLCSAESRGAHFRGAALRPSSTLQALGTDSRANRTLRQRVKHGLQQGPRGRQGCGVRAPH